jgi:hypothetical protein
MDPTASTRADIQLMAGPPRRSLHIAMFCALLAACGAVGADEPQRMSLQNDPRYILEAVARKMNVTLDPDQPLPRIYFEGSTPLEQFQEAIAPQWRFRPPMFANAYVVARNEIYLSDDPGYYRRLRRTLDESLAHEYTHYLQVRYFAANLADEGCETEAVAVQIAFREENQPRKAPGETS